MVTDKAIYRGQFRKFHRQIDIRVISVDAILAQIFEKPVG